jgi:hypothetical protein
MRSETILAQALTPAQLDAAISALHFVLAGEWDAASHDHGPEIYERALDRLTALRGRTVHCLSNQLEIQLLEARALAAEQLLSAMINGGQIISEALAEAGESFGMLHATMFGADQHLRRHGWLRPDRRPADADPECDDGIPF